MAEVEPLAALENEFQHSITLAIWIIKTRKQGRESTVFEQNTHLHIGHLRLRLC